MVRELEEKVERLEQANRILEADGRRRSEAEALLRLSVEAGGVGLWEWQIATGKLSWNDRLKAIFGLPIETTGLTLDGFLSAIHPADRAEAERTFREALATRAEFNHECRILRPDGTVRWLVAVGSGQYDASGRPERMLGAALCITPRKQAEAALRDSEHRLAESQSIAKVGSWRWDLKGPIYWTAETYRIYGVSPERFTPTLDSLSTLLHAADRPAMQRWVEACVAGERPGELQVRAVLPDGSVRTLLGRGELTCDSDGRPVHMTGTVQDITERQRVEGDLRDASRRLDTLVDNLSGFVYRGAYHPDWPVDFLSQGIFELLGYPAEEFLTGERTFGSLIAAADRDRVSAEVQAAVEARQSFVLEYRVTTATGFERWVWEKGTPVFEDGVLVALEGFVTDITERKQIKTALQESETRYRTLAGELLFAREQERAAVAREIHDELGQLLTGLKLDAAWLARHLSDGEHALSPKIAEMSALLDESIRSVRQVAASLRPAVLDDLGLPAAIERQLVDFRKRSGLRCVLHDELETIDLSPTVSIALFRIVQECFTNIARHAQASSVRVLLEEAAGDLVLEVSDDGRGISKDEMRAPTSIGITGMRERAALAGGSCAISGDPGRGTTVRVVVPLSVARKAT